VGAFQLRLLNVIGSVDIRNGGTTSYVFSTAKVWSRLGHECHVLSLDPPTAPCVVQSELFTIALGGKESSPALRRLSPVIRYGFTPALVRWLKRNAHRYDAIILHGLWNYTSFGTWRALRNSRTPYFVFPHGMLDPWLREAHPTKHMLRLLFWYLAERRVLRDAEDIFFASKDEKELAREVYARGHSKGSVMGFGTEDFSGDPDAQKTAFFLKYPQLQGRKLFLFLGRIHPKKGIDVLLQAFAPLATLYKDYDLVIAGPDDVGLKTRLEDLANELGISGRVHWTGMVVDDEKLGAIRASRFFVLPSHQENFGIAVAEALALGVPVLITKKVNIWREVESSRAGIATKSSVDGVGEGLRKMFDLGCSERQQMSVRARACFERHFDLRKNATRLVESIEASANTRFATAVRTSKSEQPTDSGGGGA
jgi:glycosyltransferase involved in cell wall biosynthesis